MFPMIRGKGFEFEAFECVLIDSWDLRVNVLFYIKQNLEGLENISSEIRVGQRKISS